MFLLFPSLLNLFCYLILLLSLLPLQVDAFVGYVSDNLSTVLYAKPDMDSDIVAYLDAGQKINIISINDAGWNKIRLEDGHIGWVENQYISSVPGRLQQILTLKKEQLELQKESAVHKKEISFLQQEIQKYRTRHINLKKQNFNQQSKLIYYEKLLKNPLKINQENLYLKKNVEFLKFDNAVLQRSIQDIDRRQQSQWQTLVIVCSLIFLLIGYIVGKHIADRRKVSWRNT